ncbi:Ig-like domain-containing protein [Staphylococcus warneri]|uniref:Ig-like domain-containing protein n=1 Tax=Staphylococcus warneri TaxID=1292 RepID=UPI0034CE634D
MHASEKTSTEEPTESNEDTASQDNVKPKGDVQTIEQANSNNDILEQVDVTHQASSTEEPKADTTEKPATKEEPKADTTEKPATKEEPKANTTEEPVTTEETSPKSTTDQAPETKQTDLNETNSEQVDQPVAKSQNSAKTQDVNTVVNDVANASITEDKQEALTNYIADANNTSQEEAKAQVESLDLDYSNKKDSKTTYARTRSTESTPKPVNRLAVRELKAVQQGSNVNDKVKTSQFNFDIKIIDPNHSGHENFDASFIIDDSVKSGDNFTFKIPKNITIDGDIDYSNLNNTIKLPNLKNANCDVIATGTYDTVNKTGKFTFTEFVDSKKNVAGKFEMPIWTDRKNTPISGN